MIEYVDLDTLEVCSAEFLKRKQPGLVCKRADMPLSDEDLAALGGARLTEPPVAGQVKTRKAVPVDGKYVREYRDFSQIELDRQAEEAVAAQKLHGIEFEGVLCSATAEDMWGLASVNSWIKAGNSVNFQFANGNTLRITPMNRDAFEAVWAPFRQSFFE